MTDDKGYVVFSPVPARPRIVPPRAPYQPMTTALVEEIKSASTIEATRKTLGLLLKLAMESVEKQGLSGQDAKKTALEIAEVIIIEKAPEGEKEWLLEAIKDDAMDGIIDLVIAASKNEVNLNQGKEVGKKCAPCLLRVFNRRAQRNR